MMLIPQTFWKYWSDTGKAKMTSKFKVNKFKAIFFGKKHKKRNLYEAPDYVESVDSIV